MRGAFMSVFVLVVLFEDYLDSFEMKKDWKFLAIWKWVLGKISGVVGHEVG
jgi:hypothetical protein